MCVIIIVSLSQIFHTNFFEFCILCVSIAIVRLPMDGRSFVFISDMRGGCVCVSVHSIIILFNVNVVQMRFRLNFSSFLDIVAAAAVGALFLFVFPILFF